MFFKVWAIIGIMVFKIFMIKGTPFSELIVNLAGPFMD